MTTQRQPLLIEIVESPRIDRIVHPTMGWYLNIRGVEYGNNVSAFVPGDLVSQARAYDRVLDNIEAFFKPRDLTDLTGVLHDKIRSAVQRGDAKGALAFTQVLGQLKGLGELR